jgi:mannosyltransferase
MATITAPQPEPDLEQRPELPDSGYEPRTPSWIRRIPTWLWVTAGLIGLMALSALFRTRYLNGQFWMDEAITTGIALHPLGKIPHVLRYDGNPPLYYMLLHLWIKAFGDSVDATHSLSVLFGILTIPAGGWGAWKLFGRRAGVMAAILFAFNAWLTSYAQETRMYELMGLLGVLATTFFVLGFVERRRRWLFAFGAVLVAMLYTHSWGTFFFIGSAISLIPSLLSRTGRDRMLLLRDAVVTYVVAGILFLPWAPTLLFQIAHTAAPWDTPPRLGAPVQISRNVLGGDRITIVLVLAAAIGLAPLFTRAQRRGPEATKLLTLIVLPLAVLLIAWLGSQVNPAWAPRYFAPVIGAMLFLIAWGCSRARLVGIVAVALSCAFLANPFSFAPKHKSDMRYVAATMGPLLHKGDTVVVGQPEQTTLAWYYLPGGLRYANTARGRVADPTYMNWVNVLDAIKRTNPVTTADRLVAQLRPGQQLLFVRPLTEGAQNWKAPWTVWVRRRSAQWGAVFARDVSDGVLRQVATAPINYPGACCVADSAVLFKKLAK